MRFLLQGNYQEAIIAFRAAIEINPRSAEAHLGLGRAYAGLGEFGSAIDALDRAVELDPASAEAMVERGYIRIIWAEELDLARSDFELALSIDERNVGAFLGLVEVYIRLGDFERALEFAKRGYELTGDPSLGEKIDELEGGTVRDSEGRTRLSRHFDSDGVLVGMLAFTYEQGRRIRVTELSPDGSVNRYMDIVYDEQGRVLRQPITSFEDGTIGTALESTYSTDGLLVRMEQLSLDGRLLTYDTYEYDERGVRTRTVGHQADGTVFRIGIHDEQGREVRTNRIGDGGEITGYSTVEFNADGNLVRFSHFDADENLEFYRIWEYDETGQVISQTRYNPDGSVHSRVEF
jgi:tetratricopeptide (TPR) repeat protein